MKKKSFWMAAILLTAFGLWTGVVCLVDVQPIGPEGSSVGVATLNQWVQRLIGVNFTLYTITDWLGLVPLAMVLGFAILGLWQWVSRRELRKVDRSILALGGFYAAVLGAFMFFETVVINFRPVLIEGLLEASYPSSTTMLVLCVMPTAGMELWGRIRSRKAKGWLAVIIVTFCTVMVVSRLLSGVHWFSDILGGILLSAGLVMIYDGCRKGNAFTAADQ